MGFSSRSFLVKFRCYVDPEIHKGFNIAICIAGHFPTDNPINQIYISPEHNPEGWYEYTFVDLLMDKEKEYEVWVQSVAVNKDSMWRSVTGVEVPDDGVGTIGTSITDITQEELDDALEGLEISGSNTNITNVNGGNINSNSIKAISVDCVNLAVSGLANINEAYIGGVHIKDNTITANKINVADLAVSGLATINEAYIGGVHIKDNAITASKINVRELAVGGLANINEAYIGGVHIMDNTITAAKIDVFDLAVTGLANIEEAYIGGVHIIDNAITADKVNVLDLAVSGLANINEAYIGGAHIGDNSISARNIDVLNLAVSGLANINEAYVGGVHLQNNSIKAVKIDVEDLAVSGLATIEEAYISGVHINNSAISAVNIDVEDLAVNGLATIEEAYINGTHIANGSIKTSHIGTATIKATNIDTNDLQVNGAATVNALLSNNAVISGALTVGDTGQIVMTGGQIFSKNGISGPGYSLSTSGLVASSGQIANWIVSTDNLKSKATGARIELNQGKSRISVIDGSNNTKVAMGYLDGLSKYDESGTWTSSDYGFWASKGNNLTIEGDIKYENGDWIIKNDGAYLIKDALNNDVVKLGTDDGEVGLFLFSYDEEVKTKIAKYTSDGILLGEEDSEGVLVSGLRFTKDGGLEIKGKITVTEGSDLGEIPTIDGLGDLAFLNSISDENVTSISGGKIVTGSIAADRMLSNQTFIGHTIKSTNFLEGSLGWQIKNDGTFEFNGEAGKRISFDGTTFDLSVPIAATDVSGLGDLALKDTIIDADVTSISGGKIVTGSIAADRMLANQTFVGHSIQSTNYAVGSAGWKIENDGKFAFHGPDSKSFTFDGSNFIFSGQIIASSNVSGLGTLATLNAVADSNITSISGGKITAGTIAADRIASNQSFIGHSIQSTNFLAGTAGWKITNNGTFEFNGTSGQKIDYNGSIFTINVPISASNVSGLGTLATQSSVTTGQISGLGDLATLDSVANTNITSIDGGKITTGYIAAARINANTITTTMINGNAVTIPVYSTGGYLNANGSLQTICQASITTGTVAARIVVLFDARIGYTDFASNTLYTLYRDGSKVLDNGVSTAVNDYVSFMYSETVAANTTVTYYVKWVGKSGGVHVAQARLFLQGAMR